MSILGIKWSVFLAGTVILYILLPGRVRNGALFLLSLFFLTYSDRRSLLPLIAVIIITYATGRLLDMSRRASGSDPSASGGRSRIILISGIISILAILVAGRTLPLYGSLGLSFYSLEAMAYLFDCHKRRIEPERNIIDLGLFLCFFCNLISGPIERADTLLTRIKQNKLCARRDLLSPERLRNGLILILWGAFLKLVIAERFHILTDTIWNDLHAHGSTALIIAALSYSLEIYSDFCGYSVIAMGSAACLGYSLTDNFNAPYLAESVRDFWKKWHRTLSSWLRDYIYIPLGGSRKGTARRYVNTLAVFAVSGLWHGTGLQFLVWGLLHGVAMCLENLAGTVHKSEDRSFGTRFFRITGTFLFVTFAWIFFRAPSLTQALVFIKQMFTSPDIWILSDPEASLLSWGLDVQELMVLVPAFLILLAADIMRKYSGWSIDEWLSAQSTVFRVVFCLFLFTYTLVFGIYGPGFASSDFIYAQF